MQKRSFFLLGSASSILTACGGGVGANVLDFNRRNLDVKQPCTGDTCGGTGDPTPGPTPRMVTISSIRNITHTNYAGLNGNFSNGVSMPSCDSYGSVVASTVVPGSQVTIAAYNRPSQSLTASHPVYSSQSFTIGTTTFSPVAGYPMWRFTDPHLGSGAVWISGPYTSMQLNLTYTGFKSFSKAVMSIPTPYPSNPPPTNMQTYCQNQAAGMTAWGTGLGIAGILAGTGAAGPASVPAATSLGALGLIISNNANSRCPGPPPNPQPGPTPTGNSYIPTGDNWDLLAGDPGWPDDGGGGPDGDAEMVC